jgi:hypothetical protein
MIRMLAAALVTLVAVSAAPAQYFGGGFADRTHYSFHGPGIHVHVRGFYAGPVAPFYYAYGWVPPYGPGYGPGYGNPFFLQQPPVILPIGAEEPAANALPIFPKLTPNPDRGGHFLVITPKGSWEQKEGTFSPRVDRVAPPPEKPVFQFNPFPDRRAIGRTEQPEADPLSEAARLAKLARTSLASGEYGQAIEWLNQALELAPGNAELTSLQSQAQFASGDYADAVKALQTGIAAHANWPALELKPRDLLGKAFDAKLADLKAAAAANPESAALQFLLAHQLWFDGRRDDAAAIFKGLTDRLANPRAVEPFLKK